MTIPVRRACRQDEVECQEIYDDPIKVGDIDKDTERWYQQRQHWSTQAQ